MVLSGKEALLQNLMAADNDEVYDHNGWRPDPRAAISKSFCRRYCAYVSERQQALQISASDRRNGGKRSSEIAVAEKRREENEGVSLLFILTRETRSRISLCNLHLSA
jgi:hypothetical protein